jgi:hypothetical protein
VTERTWSRATIVRRFPYHGWLGLGLVALFWPLNWLLDGLRTHWGFFPLWLGYCLVIDGLNVQRSGTSLLTRSRRGYLRLFLISIPLWWLFEIINWRTQNWEYLGREFFGNLEYALLSSLSFSTVVPAVLGSAELIASLDFMKRLRRGPVIRPIRRNTLVVFALGIGMLALLMAWPLYFFPFFWMFIYFLLEPLNVWLGNRSLAEWTRKGDWRPIMALWLGVWLCAFFWEMWNYFSYPKWVYHVPFVDFWHIFEMPFLGYFGYLPFSMELFAIVHLFYGLLGEKNSRYVTSGIAPGRDS